MRPSSFCRCSCDSETLTDQRQCARIFALWLLAEDSRFSDLVGHVQVTVLVSSILNLIAKCVCIVILKSAAARTIRISTGSVSEKTDIDEDRPLQVAMS